MVTSGNRSSAMEPQEYRKLNIDLPRQPIVGQRWWLLAGILLAFAILLLTAYEYIEHKKQPASPSRVHQNYHKEIGH